MKPTASNTSRRDLAELSRRLHLGRVLEATHGSGTMTADRKHTRARSGWSLEQLLLMSEAKSLYN